MLTEVHNWARFPRSRSIVIPVNSRNQEIPFNKMDVSFLPHGMGRSLGDSCLNDSNALLMTRGLNRIIAFDPLGGRLVAEAGITFDAILRFSIPQGWFLPVTPGTRFVSLGGAVANDVHGKNHHCAGTFGHHVVRFELRRSDGSRLLCSADENADWFRATIGGLGLTGLTEWVEVQLKPITNSCMDSEIIRYRDVDEFYALNAESLDKYEYAVSWADTLSSKGLGRGLFMRGNHNQDSERKTRKAPTGPYINIPGIFPFSLLNRGTLKIFNSVFYNARPARKTAVVPIRPFFYPLDMIGAHHHIYGPRGMMQWQGLIPSREAVREVLTTSADVGGSFLTVMKVMGDQPPAGLLSFSGAGVTIALDFPYSRHALETLPRLDEIVAAAGGRLYPAKDARMSGANFRKYFPQWQELLPFIDPRFSSSFWRRVTAT
ncbi:MAG: FAD-binding oxidoreductase [Acidobacteriia bacterium]|nr:FAD-binding oxidoreductase [Terriglobia bacterium]